MPSTLSHIPLFFQPFSSYSLTLLTYFTPILSLCHPTILSCSLTLTTIFVIFSYSANLRPSYSFSLPSTPVSHIHLFFQPFCLILSHSCFLGYLNERPSCSLTLLIACRALMLCHSAICMLEPHVLSLCYLHAGPSCPLTLLLACRALMLCHSAICIQDPRSLTLRFACRPLTLMSSHSSNCMHDPHVQSLCAGPSCSVTLRRTLMFSHSANYTQDPQVPHVLLLF